MAIEIECKKTIKGDKNEILFKKGLCYDHADDRGDDGGACMYAPEVGRKIYMTKYNYEDIFKERDYKKLAKQYLEVLEKVQLKLNSHNRTTGYSYGLEIGLCDEMNEITDILVKEKL